MSEKLEKEWYKLGSPQNLTKTAREKGTVTIRQNRQENENWRRAISYSEHDQMKYGQVNYSEISRQLNQIGYKTRVGCLFCPRIVRRLLTVV